MTKPDEAPRLAEWLTATEVADLFGVSRQTVNQMIASGEFQSLHVIGPRSRPQYLVRRSEAEILKNQREFPRGKLRSEF
ncbi:helix-turn-helix domain-containing protein [Nocardioides tweenelious]|uniref:helix-turn-helix domain-containing protein n=1 Tax=Nocardioides tweenelious TaxID=3156607 RepID=UPI003CCCB98E